MRRGTLLAIALCCLAAVCPQRSFADPSEFLAELETHFAAVLADEGRLEQWRRAYLERRRAWLEGALQRGAMVQPQFEKVLAEMGLPRVLSYLPMVESGFRPNATSIMAAGGYWQFIPSTARHYGLTLDRWVDERRDPHVSTHAAGRYLAHLYRMFDEWPLALMAYNSGEGRVLGIIRRLGSRDYKEIVRSVRTPGETSNYVAGFVAATQIAVEPEAYGVFVRAPDEPPTPTEEVAVKGSVDLAFVAREIEVDEHDLRVLNPALLQGCTPPQETTYPLRVPEGTGEVLAMALADAPQNLYTRWTAHLVRPGEALSLIARKYQIPSRDIARFNNLKDLHSIRAGRELVIPIPQGRPLPKVASARRHKRQPAFRDYRRVTYKVASGDSLWTIASRYGTTSERVRKWNGLLKREVIHPGDELLLYVPKGSRPKARRHIARHDPNKPLPPDYRVASGDTLWNIARRFGLAMEDLAAWNGITAAAILRPDQILRLKPRPFVVHEVVSGESLWEIARHYKTTVDALRRHNRLGSSGIIRPGDTLKIPTMTGA
jgi:membrane-bound lytic murein transglycosylase D